MEFYAVEGNRQRLDGGAMFGNAPRALWSKWLEPDAGHRVRLATRGLYVPNLDGKAVLFETGVGAFLDPDLSDRYGVFEREHMLLRSLDAVDASHEDIDVVVLSHLHFDHAGGLLTAYRQGMEPELLFPNAKFLVSCAAWQRARKPHLRDRASFIPQLPGLLEASGRLELVDDAVSPTLGDAVQLHFSNGHTPGLMISQIGGTGGVLFCSDLIPGRPWAHLPVSMGYDRCAEQLIDEKRRILQMVVEQQLRLCFVHDIECAFARVQVDARGRYSAIPAT